MSAGRYSCRANGPRRCARRVRATAHSTWPHAWRKAMPPATPLASRRQHAIMPVPAVAQPSVSSGKAFVDFQNDVTAEGHRHRRAGRLPLDRACQALHHDRHGDRSGQDFEHECAGDGRRPDESASAAGRPHHLSHAVHAGDVRRAGRRRARCAVRTGAPHADPRLGRSAGRGVRECRYLAARPLVSARRRGHAPRRRARMSRSAQRGRHVRRHHARQDRGGWPRRGGVPRPPLYRQLHATCRRVAAATACC